MYRGPSYGGRSKATATTLCQKCLKRDIYECTASAQDRPYTSRPSRTQQLLNPKLAPKLMTDVPNDLLRKKGVADEQLAKKADERGQKHSHDDGDAPIPPRKRSRSVSSYSSSSVSTISTNASLSPPPRKSKQFSRDRSMGSPRRLSGDRKRRRRSTSSSSDSYTSESSVDRKGSKEKERNTRRRLSSFSPVERGRRRSRSSISSRMETSKSRSPARNGGKRPRSPSLDRMRSKSRSRGRRPRSPLSRHMSLSRSRSRNGRVRLPLAKRMTESRSRSRSPNPARNARSSNSRSPLRAGRRRSPARRSSRSRSRSPYARQRRDHIRDQWNGPRDGPRSRPFNNRRPSRTMDYRPTAPQPPPVRKERSLSPYSKRLALTQAMNMGGR
ncbi:uncharacterized protein K441DRAFT_689118 [Cenococcum geophilum 1.58]|uniref:uncharacterized protein n=1 Tax=Cenococcum geophilum 1.58 TaxID=794803 RepID=UPI00358F32B2|nr:hypothetical protein K441DRAFT_689118 [Cenococcum geophilum 1.58]